MIEPQYSGVLPLGDGLIWAYEGEDEKLLNRDGSEIKIEPAP